jgi:hypothetical protein
MTIKPAGVLSTNFVPTANNFPFSTTCITFDTTEKEKKKERRSLTEKKKKKERAK